MSTTNRQRGPRRSMRSDNSLDRDQRGGVAGRSRQSNNSGAAPGLMGRTTPNHHRDEFDDEEPPSTTVPKAYSLPSHKARHFRKQFSTSTLVRRTEIKDVSTPCVTPILPIAQTGMSLEKLTSLSTSMKSLESINVNLQNQAKKLEQGIQSLANVQSNDPLFPTKRLSQPVQQSTKELTKKLPPRHRSKSVQPTKSSKPEAPNHSNLASPSNKKSKTKSIVERAASKSEFPILELTIPAGGTDMKKKKKKPKEVTSNTVQVVDDEGLVVVSAHSASADKKEAHSKLVAAKSQGTLVTTQDSLASGSNKNQPSVEYSVSGCSTKSDHESKQSIHSNSITATALKRFQVTKERTRREQIDSLTERQRECLALLRVHWEADHEPISRFMYLRFARYCKFELRKGQGQLSRFDERYLSLTATQLEPQLLTRTLFPIPGLKSIKGHDMFYARPAMHNPQTTDSQTITDTLAYVMLTMIEKEDAATNGVGMLAYMNDCSMTNFTVESCLNFMKMLQGGMPARVRLVLIVNPPGWFGKLWKVMKPMLHPTFQRKIQIIPERMLSAFLAPDYAFYLPEEMEEGTVDTKQLVKDYIVYRKYVEAKKSWLTLL